MSAKEPDMVSAYKVQVSYSLSIFILEDAEKQLKNFLALKAKVIHTE